MKPSFLMLCILSGTPASRDRSVRLLTGRANAYSRSTSRTQRRFRGSPAQTAPLRIPPPPANSSKARTVKARRTVGVYGGAAGGRELRGVYLGPAPVLVGEGEGGERADAPGAGEPHRLLQRAPPGLVPGRGRQPARARPPRVPVHHHRHVPRQRLRAQGGREERGLGRRCCSGARAWRGKARAAGGSEELTGSGWGVG